LRTISANKIIDPDEYLPKDTLQWCRTQLLTMNFDPEKPPAIPQEDRLSPHRTIYLQLRQKIQIHIQCHENPVLALSERPTGGFNWQPSSIDASIQPITIVSDELYEEIE
jgi:hypothetical protein